MEACEPRAEPTVTVKGLTLRYGGFEALSNVSMEIGRGRILGIVGESGSGKSTMAKAILGLLPSSATITEGEILFDKQDLSRISADALRDIRGQRITYISQDPLRALTPTLTIGDQMTDIQYRSGLSMSEKKKRAVAMLDRVGMPDPEQRLGMYPHELSGGQRQRVSIAMAVMMQPDLLIADEATTALDATLEQEIIKLLKELQREIGCSMMFVTHHLGVVASLCDDVVVMHNGIVREAGTVPDVFGNPQDAYTKMLLRCDPAWISEKTRHLPITSDDPDAPIVIETGPPDRIKSNEPPILDIEDLHVTFSKNGLLEKLFGDAYDIEAVKGVNLHLHEGETLAIVGESGSGKTTVARTIIGLQKADSGSVKFGGRELLGLSAGELKSIRKEITFIFQDPIGSLSPRMRVADTVVEPLRIHDVKTADFDAEAARLLDLVGLNTDYMERYPHELSGGQARRVAVARAIALEPSLIIADEPTAGLDVSIQGEVLNLLAEIQDRTGVAMLMITHNLNVVRHVSDRVAIMYQGNFLELETTERIFENPQHDYTRRLIAANHHPNF
ncbi:MAG: ABC transporter ATP-binding protein [Alphaproteobacteria bacterium]